MLVHYMEPAFLGNYKRNAFSFFNSESFTELMQVALEFGFLFISQISKKRGSLLPSLPHPTPSLLLLKDFSKDQQNQISFVGCT